MRLNFGWGQDAELDYVDSVYVCMYIYIYMYSVCIYGVYMYVCIYVHVYSNVTHDIYNVCFLALFEHV